MNKRMGLYGLMVGLLLLSSLLGCGGGDKDDAPTPLPDWEKFSGRGAELWLPDSFEGGDLSQDLDTVIEGLEKLGPDFEQMANTIKQNPSMFVIWAFDSQVGDSGFLTNVNVTTEQALSTITIETYLDLATQQLPSQFKVLEREIVSLDRYEAGRVLLEFSVSGVQGKQLLYVIKPDKDVWAITYSTAAEEFDERLSTFEQSINTFVAPD